MNLKRIFFYQLFLALAIVFFLISIILSIDSVYTLFLEDLDVIIYLTIQQLKIFFLSSIFAIIVAFWIGYAISQNPLKYYSGYFSRF